MPYALAIHGGAGVIARSHMTADREAASLDALREALAAGEMILKAGGSALDAAQAAVVSLENCPLFNAGRGSVFDASGNHSFDASIMDGETRKCGAVASATAIKNPIIAARAVMDNTPHIVLAGSHADDFARTQGLDLEPPSYFFTTHRHEQLLRARERDEVVLDHGSSSKMGTVGAVALDKQGNIAAANSTGGMTNKLPGRVGDSAIIGAGTWAHNQTCAVCTTGIGEAFIKTHAASRVASLIEFSASTLDEACHWVIFADLPQVDGSGGLIALNRWGDIAMPFNSGGMYRGKVKEGEAPLVAIWDDEQV